MDKTTQATSLFHNYPLPQRQALYYGVCIWVRALLIYLVWRFWDIVTVRIAVLAVLIFSMIRLWRTRNEDVWWSRKTHLAFAILLYAIIAVSLWPSTFTNNDLQLWLKRTFTLVISLDLILGFMYSFVAFA